MAHQPQSYSTGKKQSFFVADLYCTINWICCIPHHSDAHNWINFWHQDLGNTQSAPMRASQDPACLLPCLQPLGAAVGQGSLKGIEYIKVPCPRKPTVTQHFKDPGCPGTVLTIIWLLAPVPDSLIPRIRLVAALKPNWDPGLSVSNPNTQLRAAPQVAWF